MRIWSLAAMLVALSMPSAAEAADCVTVRQGDVSLVENASCAGLKLMSRKRDDERSNVDIKATWVEFATPGNAGEWRYNDSIRKQVARINFDRPLTLVSDQKGEDRLVIESLYRSERLISARFARWTCCGTHGTTSYSSINVDIERWTLLSADDLVDPGVAANFCWQQFGNEQGRGDAFAKAYERARPWTDDDFDHHRIGRPTSEFFTAVLLSGPPSKERTQRLFTAVVKDTGRWSFTGQGALIDFGELLGSVAGPFVCSFRNSDLKGMARRGISFPP